MQTLWPTIEKAKHSESRLSSAVARKSHSASAFKECGLLHSDQSAPTQIENSCLAPDVYDVVLLAPGCFTSSLYSACCGQCRVLSCLLLVGGWRLKQWQARWCCELSSSQVAPVKNGTKTDEICPLLQSYPGRLAALFLKSKIIGLSFDLWAFHAERCRHRRGSMKDTAIFKYSSPILLRGILLIYSS